MVYNFWRISTFLNLILHDKATVNCGLLLQTVWLSWILHRAMMSYRTRAYFQVSRCYAIEICLPQYPDTSLFFNLFFDISCFTLAFHLLLQDKCFILRQLSRSKDRKNYFIISEITHCRFRRNTTRVNIDVGRNSFVCAVVWFPSICLSKTILYKHPLCNIVYFFVWLLPRT